jgi:Lrp/AsnC family leucine-responsive transcriptional regulator
METLLDFENAKPYRKASQNESPCFTVSMVKYPAMSAAPSPYPSSTRIDLRILRVLQADGRITNLKLAEAVHLSPTAVLERVKRLTRDGVILGYEARLDPAQAGRRAAGVHRGAARPHRARRDGHVPRRGAGAAEILECHLVAGGFDYLLKTRVADMAAYRALLGSSIWALPGVRETRTYAVMEEVKSTQQLAL